MKKQSDGEKGAIIIEATISLTAFMFAIITLLTIVNICIVQARMAVAINMTAKEISQYSYLYSLTGFQKSEAELSNAASEETKELNQILTDVNTVFNEIEALGQTGNSTPDDIDSILASWDGMLGSAQKIESAGSSIESTIENIAKDPKKLMFGIAKLAASNTLEFAKSRMIAAPLAKVMCQKHLVSSANGTAEAYLQSLGVVPGATGSYIDGLDFSKSSIFPYGSNEITVSVTYKVKVIALLPIDFSFQFHQTAVTHGWLAGESSYQKSSSYKDNDTLWTKSTVQERSSLIRHMAIDDMEKEGYSKTTKLTDVQLYNAEKNEFAMIASMNPLYSSEDEETKTLADIDEAAVQKGIEQLCGKIQSTTDGLTKVTTKTQVNGAVTKTENACGGAKNKIVLVIPEDDGLKEKIEAIIEKSNTNGVTIEVIASYGNGAKQTETAGGE